jgi:hypothetical protein
VIHIDATQLAAKAPFDDALESRLEHEISWASLKRRSGDWRSGSALRSHRRGHWFEPSIAHFRFP